MYVEFKKGEKYADKGADISDDLNTFEDAGYILNETDFVIDIDTLPKDIIQAIIRDFNIATQIVWTERGVHLYFKKPSEFKKGAERVSPLGFKYEIKHAKNTIAVTIKRNGKARVIENEGIREEPPFIFRSNKKYEVLYGMDDGEGRNNALFRLRGALNGQQGWKKIVRFVNTYILAEPLSDDEMDVLTRDMVVNAEKDNEYEVANHLLHQFDFLKYGERFYFKADKEYVFDDGKLRNLVYSFVGNQKSRYVDEVVKQMQYRCKLISNETIFKIKFLNGYLWDGEFYDIVTDDFSPYMIDVEYDPDTEPIECVDNYISHLTKNDTRYRKLLLEILGHTLIVNHEFKRMLAKFFIFVGDGGNGKGTLLQIIKAILGTKNTSAMGIKELSDERYLASFKGKLANLGDDIQDQSINDKDMKILKNISTCDYISTRELYKNAENMFFTGSLVFTSNHILKSWEKGVSYKRRVLWLPMYSKVTKKESDFITRLTSEQALKYWIKLIVEGYKRLYVQRDFTRCELVDDFNEEYHRTNNPAFEYLQGMCVEDFKNKPIADIQADYAEWCASNEDLGTKVNVRFLNLALEESFGLVRSPRRINGKSAKVYVVKKDQ